MKNFFIQGPITPQFIADSISKHQTKTSIGAHSIFLGQIRADEKENSVVTAIEYTAHEEMALLEMHKIREATFQRFDITCMHVYHSLGKVNSGEICLFVFSSSQHRKECTAAIEHLVEQIKKKLPIFGKEILEDNSHVWKENN
ncbi:MAG: molybdenum cofactor biosynthesis protein MoaE [Bacteroidia bacterium]|nr:molybdenum cofactor biosynthesis protein MoaE [Bacteroidia bacterium]